MRLSSLDDLRAEKLKKHFCHPRIVKLEGAESTQEWEHVAGLVVHGKP